MAQLALIGAVGMIGATGYSMSEIQGKLKIDPKLKPKTFSNTSKEERDEIYNNLTPGDLIRRVSQVDASGMKFEVWHYAIYMGKNPETGEHEVVHSQPQDNGIPAIVKTTTEKSLQSDSLYEQVKDSKKENLSREEIMTRANALVGKNIKYSTLYNNCETIARNIAQNTNYSEQTEQLSGFTKVMASKVLEPLMEKLMGFKNQGISPPEIKKILDGVSSEFNLNVKSENESKKRKDALDSDIKSITFSDRIQIFLKNGGLDKMKNKEKKDMTVNGFCNLLGISTPKETMEIINSSTEEIQGTGKRLGEASLLKDYLFLLTILPKEILRFKKINPKSDSYWMGYFQSQGIAT